QKAVSAFSESPDVKQQFTHPNYTALRFICNFLLGLIEGRTAQTAFEATWAAFLAELNNPQWTFVAASPLTNIEIPSQAFELEDGVTAQRQHFSVVAEELNRTAQTMREFFGHSGLSLSPYSL